MKNTAEQFIETLSFIEWYRGMESDSISNNKKLLKKIIPEDKLDHLIDSWSGRDNNFGSFYTNLEYELQGLFLVHWGLDIEGFEEYIKEIDSSPYASIYTHPPYFISWINAMMVFFLNHGIDAHAIPGFYLPLLPDKEHRFGNSRNWGEYLRSLDLDHKLDVLAAIEEYVADSIELQKQNRDFLRKATDRKSS